MKHTKDMSVGSPLVALILFSLPIILGNLFQQFYNLMDIAIVGNKLGDDALAAVGATAALYGLFLSLAFGAANGFSLVIARYFGSKDIKGLHKAFAHALKLAILIAVILTVVALFFTRPLLQLLHTPDVELSYRYISVVLLGITVTVFYNTLSSVLRAVGNSVAPLIFLIIGAFVNVGLDFAFIVLFDMGVFGAGLATVISQVVSCTLTVVSADLDTETAVISRNSNCPVIIKTPEYETVYDENVEPIGVNRHMKPLMYEVPLTAGMLIVSYTDGIAHAGKKRLGHPADFEKIMEIVRKNEAEDVSFIAKSIMDYALELDAEKASDDMTVLVMGITDGSPSSPKIEQLEVTYPY